MKRYLQLLFVIILFPAPLSADMKSANQALNSGNYTQAAEEFRVLADQGDANAQSHLGYLYYVGEGVPQSFTEAVKWYEKAAVQGNRDAQYNLAVAYAFGEGIKQNYNQAAIWYRRAAEQGHPVAQYSLGISYAYGEGVEQDQKIAAEWFLKSAEQGYENAEVMAGSLYHTGEGLPKDYTKAITWYKKAAARGNATAQYNLGTMYRAGKGVSRNTDEAIQWFRLAADQGYEAAQTELSSLERAMASVAREQVAPAATPPVQLSATETTQTNTVTATTPVEAEQKTAETSTIVSEEPDSSSASTTDVTKTSEEPIGTDAVTKADTDTAAKEESKGGFFSGLKKLFKPEDQPEIADTQIETPETTAETVVSAEMTSEVGPVTELQQEAMEIPETTQEPVLGPVLEPEPIKAMEKPARRPPPKNYTSISDLWARPYVESPQTKNTNITDNSDTEQAVVEVPTRDTGEAGASEMESQTATTEEESGGLFGFLGKMFTSGEEEIKEPDTVAVAAAEENKTGQQEITTGQPATADTQIETDPGTVAAGEETSGLQENTTREPATTDIQSITSAETENQTTSEEEDSGGLFGFFGKIFSSDEKDSEQVVEEPVTVKEKQQIAAAETEDTVTDQEESVTTEDSTEAISYPAMTGPSGQQINEINEPLQLAKADESTSTPVLGTETEAAIAASKTGSINSLQQQAVEGDALAQYELGKMYYEGKLVKQDYGEAFLWYRRSALQGLPDAQYNLGTMYLMGEGIMQSDIEAKTWYEKAAVQGHSAAQHNLQNLQRIVTEDETQVPATEISDENRQLATEKTADKDNSGGLFGFLGKMFSSDKDSTEQITEEKETGIADATQLSGVNEEKEADALAEPDAAISYSAKTGPSGQQLSGQAVEETIPVKEGQQLIIAKAEPEPGPEITQQTGEPVTVENQAVVPETPATSAQETGNESDESGGIFSFFGKLFGSDDEEQSKEVTTDNVIEESQLTGANTKPGSLAATDGDQQPATADEHLSTPEFKSETNTTIETSGTKPIDPVKQREVEEYLKLAEQNDAAAQAHLGYMYYVGEGVVQNYAEAMHWFRKAAVQGDSYAQYNLAVMHAFGEGTKQNMDEAVIWYRRAADQNHPVAQYSLATCYFYGEGVSQDEKTAAEWYLKSAANGYENAQVMVGNMYHTGEGLPKNYDGAAAWYRKAADNGNADAQYNLGTMYLMGNGFTQSDVEARNWFVKAASQGHTAARYNLENLQRVKEQQQLTIAKAEQEPAPETTEQSTEPVIADQQVVVAETQSNEQETPEESDDSGGVFSYFGKLFGSDDKEETVIEEAPTVVAETEPESSATTKRDQQPSEPGGSYAAPSVEQQSGNTDEPLQLAKRDEPVPAADISTEAETAIEKSTSDPKELLRQRAVEGDPQAQYELGRNYYEGTGVKQDYSEAFLWYRRSALQGQVDAQYNLGTMYLMGEGITQSDVEAKNWYEMAAAQGHTAAQHNLENLKRIVVAEDDTGDSTTVTSDDDNQLVTDNTDEKDKSVFGFIGGLFKSDEDEASTEPVVSAQNEPVTHTPENKQPDPEKSSAESDFDRGIAYTYGEGAPQDYVIAFKYFSSAAEQGYAAAQYQLGIAYTKGYGVKRDPVAAVDWYEKSARQGYAIAQRLLGNIYMNGDGVPVNKPLALAWYSIVADQGNALDIHRRDSLKNELTESERQEANRLRQQLTPGLSTANTTF